MRYVGLMSGTSLDGVDAAVGEVDAEAGTATAAPFKLQATHFTPFPADLRSELLRLHQPSHDELHRAQLTGLRLAGLYAEAVRGALKSADVDAGSIKAIGCHGQTVRHRP